MTATLSHQKKILLAKRVESIYDKRGMDPPLATGGDDTTTVKMPTYN